MGNRPGIENNPKAINEEFYKKFVNWRDYNKRQTAVNWLLSLMKNVTYKQNARIVFIKYMKSVYFQLSDLLEREKYEFEFVKYDTVIMKNKLQLFQDKTWELLVRNINDDFNGIVEESNNNLTLVDLLTILEYKSSTGEVFDYVNNTVNLDKNAKSTKKLKI